MRLGATCALRGLFLLTLLDSAGGTFVSFRRERTDSVFAEALFAPLMSGALRNQPNCGVVLRGRQVGGTESEPHSPTRPVPTHGGGGRPVRFGTNLWTLHFRALRGVYGASWRLELIMASLIIYPTICWCSVNHKSVVFLLLCLNVFPPETAPPRPVRLKIFTFWPSFGSLHPATHPLFRPLVGFSPPENANILMLHSSHSACSLTRTFCQSACVSAQLCSRTLRCRSGICFSHGGFGSI